MSVSLAPRHAAHDYVRAGTTTLFAALGVATGKVIGSLHRRHDAAEFKKFLTKLDKEVPADRQVQLILDNHATHKAPDIKKWLLAHPRFRLHFAPTSASWLNLAERWFAELTQRKLKRGVHRSVQALERDIRAGLADRNEHPRPFVWTKTADEILARPSPRSPGAMRRWPGQSLQDGPGTIAWVVNSGFPEEAWETVYPPMPLLSVAASTSRSGHPARPR